ncbi:hypothetical protein ACE193_22740 [Bernardetia sp. OM2101]|uniref:hypothetical protein n=1 Tax=Bernardetia sp. OM2101 TaxID=3344876 RepID=UPI0035D12CBE
MKLKLFILFLLVFAAIGQTIFLNIDAKSNFLEEKSKNTYTHSSESELNKSSIQPSEVVVTIRQHESDVSNQDVSSDTEATIISTKPTTKKPCNQETKEERLICQKAKDAAKQKQTRISGSNHAKSSTIQNP